MNAADVILHNGKVATMDSKQPEAQSLALPDGRLFAVGLAHDTSQLRRNGTASRVCGATKHALSRPSDEIQPDTEGDPAGFLIARPNARILYAAQAQGPKLPLELQANSARLFMRELDRLGATSCFVAGGG